MLGCTSNTNTWMMLHVWWTDLVAAHSTSGGETTTNGQAKPHTSSRSMNYCTTWAKDAEPVVRGIGAKDEFVSARAYRYYISLNISHTAEARCLLHHHPLSRHCCGALCSGGERLARPLLPRRRELCPGISTTATLVRLN